ncbi:transcriptional regulator with HTH domain and aminotransferase domain [Thioflavicoccus mobilis 8321]|uniref:Transcriptional regulator with HTH domain and aminotransferase domain n=1 Tax=Thioflavicoccus mobilis 8321 TaxID=765912 RepID=L0GY86_9GAMM|nr:PLP-dependent aminotransferase family protein [Thioflavicoccus mobilis]AGA90787.1 transcriptional regulator with HTH domain and aminotransferase domain [Thioflavicoccus mobilis 8321]
MADFLYEDVARRIGELIEQGTFASGSRLPGLRKLSRQFGVSLGTVIAACALLEERGLVIAQPRSGHYVAEQEAESLARPEVGKPAEGPALIHGQERVLALVQAHNAPAILPFGAAVPAVEFLPSGALDRSFARVRRGWRQRVASYDFPPGAMELRVQIARRMAMAGCQIGPDEVVVTNGCQEALTLSLRTVAKPGDVVAIESPTFYGILQAIESQGMRALEIATYPSDGICLTSLERALTRWPIKACVLMPNFGNPLGHLSPETRKAELVGLLRKHGVVLIEDDVYGELAFDHHRPWAAKAYDEQGDVLYCSSFSKTLGSGLRLGWAVPGRYRDRLTYLKYASSQAAPTLQALAIADYLERGGYDRFLRGLQRRLRVQVRRVIDAVGRHFPPGTRVTRPRGGFVVWVALPPGTNALHLQEQAMVAGISIAPGPVFSNGGGYDHCIRLNCALPWCPESEAALAELGRLAMRQRPMT